MGPLADLFEIWLDRLIFEASAVNVPPLVVHGDADLFADRKLAKELPQVSEVGIPARRAGFLSRMDGQLCMRLSDIISPS